MYEAVERLIQLVPPPAGSSPVEWGRVESELGVQLPEDYKQLVDLYGPGIFDDRVILYGVSVDESVDLIANTRELHALHTSFSEDPYQEGEPAVVWPDTGGLICWGEVPSADYLCWRPEEDPPSWSVVAQMWEEPVFVDVAGRAADVVLGVVTARVVVPGLEDATEAQPHTFESYR